MNYILYSEWIEIGANEETCQLYLFIIWSFYHLFRKGL